MRMKRYIKILKVRYERWKYDREIISLARKRYKVISDMGIDWLKEIIIEKENGKEYWDAVLDSHKKRIYFYKYK